MEIFSPLKLSNLVRYVNTMIGHLIQELCDQSRAGGGVTKKIILDHKGGGGGDGGVTKKIILDHKGGRGSRGGLKLIMRYLNSPLLLTDLRLN